MIQINTTFYYTATYCLFCRIHLWMPTGGHITKSWNKHNHVTLSELQKMFEMSNMGFKVKCCHHKFHY